MRGTDPPGVRPVDQCDRLIHLSGEQVQCDLWLPGHVVPDHRGVLRSFAVLAMVAACPRFIAPMIIPTKVTGDLLAGMQMLLSESEAALGPYWWDNEAGIGQRGRLAQRVTGFCGVLGTRLIQDRPYDPETESVERANGYLDTSFLPDEARSVIVDPTGATTLVHDSRPQHSLRTGPTPRLSLIDLPIHEVTVGVSGAWDTSEQYPPRLGCSI